MSSCKHASWLTCTRRKETFFCDTGRLSRLLLELTNPSRQRPSVLLFLGRKAKEVALRELFPWNNLKKSPSDGLATLRVETLSIQSEFPIFFAESDPCGVATTQAEVSALCHETSQFPVQWTLPASQTLYDVVHARLFSLFVDVLCVFADDFRSFEDVVSRLHAWAVLGRASVQFSEARPKVIIVKQGVGPGPSSTYDLLESEYLHFNLCQAEFVQFFSSVTVLHLADQQISCLARHRPLRELLQRQTTEMRHVKQSIGCLFSARHLSWLFCDAIQHTAKTVTEPFDFLLSSRRLNPIPTNFSEHLSNFLRLSTQYNVPQRMRTALIASTLLLDAYPPDMHYFDPELVYDHIYQPFCLQSLEIFYKGPLVRHQSYAIKDKLIDQFAHMQISKKPAAVIHRHNLASTKVPWMQLRSNRTCLVCLRRKPENTFTCGHGICDTCVRIFGRPALEAEYTYELENCPFNCAAGQLKVALKPPTAGTRILSIDGGGIRGVVPLEFLGILQDTIGPGCPVQDLFDLAFGTSSGGLIVLGLFLRQWGVSQCVQMFDSLTRQFFSSRLRREGGVLHHIRHLLRCWLSDGYYDVAALEAALKQNFGVHQRMFGSLPSNIATKAAVTATTISDALPVILSNYNGVGDRQADCGYRHLRPADVTDEPYVWEAGRATTAAPLLFRPTQISSLGTFQDGGLKHNNPINLALWKSRHIWPAVNQPDIVVSLGTGTSMDRNSPSPRAANFRHVIYDGFVPRLWRSFMSSLDGQGAWRDLWNRLDDSTRGHYFRSNIYLPDTALAIDDIDRMDELRDHVHTQPHNDLFRQTTPFALLISTFFFELTSVPFFQNSKVYCKGSIRCRLAGHVICRALTRVHPSDLVFMTDNEILGYYNGDEDLCHVCHRYQKEVEFTVRHNSEPMTIFVQSTEQGRRRISGFPQTIQWFREQQHLDADFGKPFHDSPRACNCNPQEPHRYSLLPKRKGGEHYSQGLSARKRPRLR